MAYSAPEIAADLEAWRQGKTFVSIGTPTPRAYPLFAKICQLSEAQTWDQAKLEWDLLEIRRATQPHECLCGHTPILDLCFIKNRLNGAETIVGNCCIQRFEQRNLDLLGSLSKVSKAPSKSLSLAVINVAYKAKVINGWETDFYIEIRSKRSLSPRQAAKKADINRKILGYYLKQEGEK